RSPPAVLCYEEVADGWGDQAELVVSGTASEVLEQWAQRPKTAQALAQRARNVLECTTGAANTAVEARAASSAQVANSASSAGARASASAGACSAIYGAAGCTPLDRRACASALNSPRTTAAASAVASPPNQGRCCPSLAYCRAGRRTGQIDS